MKYAEALKIVNTKSIADNYMIIKLGWSNAFIVSHKQGLLILEALNTAELFEDKYKEDSVISPITKDTITVSLFSRKEYVDIKMAKLLGTTVAEMNAEVPEAIILE